MKKVERAVVTGSGGGLGRAFALELAARGATVVVSDIREQAAEETAELVRRAGGEALVLPCDVRDAAAFEALARDAEAKLGPVDLVINNAGVAVSGPVGEVALEDWKFVVDVNLYGVIHGCHVFAPRMKARKSGAILNVASAAGLISAPLLGPYNVTKAGVVALSETMRAELAPHGVRVTVLCPTFFATGILDAARGVVDERMREGIRKIMSASRLQADHVAKYALDTVAADKLYAVPMFDGSSFWRLKRAAPELFPKLAVLGKRLMG
jgi:NAD(P)-dependent dehydrogenase (short-subunit alcohol dehydrogenase family)